MLTFDEILDSAIREAVMAQAEIELLEAQKRLKEKLLPIVQSVTQRIAKSYMAETQANRITIQFDVTDRVADDIERNNRFGKSLSEFAP
jgi:tagatose-1,6-bisphosphate aldolase non-catalytic subunit AgaZ/GatZ